MKEEQRIKSKAVTTFIFTEETIMANTYDTIEMELYRGKTIEQMLNDIHDDDNYRESFDRKAHKEDEED